MSEQNRALATRWFDEVWNQGKESTVDELFHPEGHCYGFPEPESDLVGPEAFKTVHRQFLDAFSGINITVEEIIVEGDPAAARWTSHMTHTSAALGFPASAKKSPSAAPPSSTSTTARSSRAGTTWTSPN